MVTCLFVVQCKGTLQRSLDIPPMSKNFLLEGHVTKTVIYYDKKITIRKKFGPFHFESLTCLESLHGRFECEISAFGAVSACTGCLRPRIRGCSRSVFGFEQQAFEPAPETFIVFGFIGRFGRLFHERIRLCRPRVQRRQLPQGHMEV